MAFFSYFFSLLVISCQIFILFQSPCQKYCQTFILIQSRSQNWPVFHTFSVSSSESTRFSYFIISLSKFARFAYFFCLLVKICQISGKICQIVILFQSSQNLGIGKLSTIEEISESYFKKSNPFRARASSGGPEGRSCDFF